VFRLVTVGQRREHGELGTGGGHVRIGDGRDLRRPEHEHPQLVPGAEADRLAGPGRDLWIRRDDEDKGLAAAPRAAEDQVSRPAVELVVVDAKLDLEHAAHPRPLADAIEEIDDEVGPELRRRQLVEHGLRHREPLVRRDVDAEHLAQQQWHQLRVTPEHLDQRFVLERGHVALLPP